MKSLSFGLRCWPRKQPDPVLTWHQRWQDAERRGEDWMNERDGLLALLDHVCDELVDEGYPAWANSVRLAAGLRTSEPKP